MVNPPNHVTPIGLTAALLLASVNTPLTQATIVIDPDNTGATDVTPAYNGVADPWDVGGTLIVGDVNTGVIDINDGSTINNGVGIIGDKLGSTGTVTLTDAGSSWSNTGALAIGNAGNATMTVSNGATVTSSDFFPSQADSFIGFGTDSTGTATITGSGSIWTVGQRLHIGFGGFGTLNIEAGGSVSVPFRDALIGSQDGATGEVAVTGAGSTWDIDRQLTVGATINGSTFGGSGTLLIADGGSVTNRDFAIVGDGFGFTGAGTVTVTGAGSTWTIGGWGIFIDEADSLNIQDGATVVTSEPESGLRIAGTGTVNLSGGTLSLSIKLDNSAGGSFNFTGGTLKATQYLGNLTNAGGTFAPGRPTALSTISGSYTQDATSTLQIELGGPLAGTEYDQLDIAGQVALAGSLDVLLINGFAPTVGDSFTVLTSTTGITGVFTRVIGGEGFDVSYGLNAITLTAQLLGDMNGDGFVGVDDLNIILLNWNAGTPPGDLASTTTPEPGAGLLLGISGWVLLRRRPAC